MMRWLMLCVVACFFAGCLPSTRVVKNPCDQDRGIRYYRPKPYLFISPHKDKNSNIATEYVDIEVKMMPDFSEEYSIHVRSGWGTNDTEITLTDGWNLTSLNVDVDSQFNENVAAITEGIAKAVKTGGGGEAFAPGYDRQTVRAHNVPMGFYEAEISRDSCGVKRMYGWRYIGFSPYESCPTDVTGVQCVPCNQRELYGLVYEGGAMVFKPLHSLPHVDTRPVHTGGLERLKDQLQNEISKLVPAVLSNIGIEDVSPQDIVVTEDAEKDLVTVKANLTKQQLHAFQDSRQTRFDVANKIALVVQQLHGVDLHVRFVASEKPEPEA